MLLLLLTALHFCVDGACAASMASYAVSEPFLAPIVFHFGLYNLIAFGGQAPTGLLLDRRPRAVSFALAFSLLALLFGAACAPRILWRTIALGLGNCAFHAAAGRLVLCRYEGFGAPGVFVSAGAVGLGLGLQGLVGALPFLLADTLAMGAVLWRLRREGARREAGAADEGAEDEARSLRGMGASFFRADAGRFGAEAKDAGVRVPLLCGGEAATLCLCASLLLACVVLRGFGGGSAASLGMALPCVMAAGKAIGGLVCDRLGYRRTVLLVFLVSFAALQGTGLSFSLLLAFAFNMTMPLTLRLAHWCRPTRPGLMFGLAAGCLLPGAFFAGAVAVPRAAMAVLQFLTLFLAGALLCRAYAGAGGRGALAGEGRARP